MAGNHIQQFRRFRFRIYDLDNKEMLYFMDGWSEDTDMLNGVWRQLEACNQFVMQSTNILDKNGREIFEGDVINYYWYNSSTCSQFTVCWDEKHAKFVLRDEKDKIYKNAELDISHKYEVIGNIYE